MMLLVIALGFIIGVNIFVFTLYIKSYKVENQEIKAKLEDTRGKISRITKQVTELTEQGEIFDEEIKNLYTYSHVSTRNAVAGKTNKGSRDNNRNNGSNNGSRNNG